MVDHSGRSWTSLPSWVFHSRLQRRILYPQNVQICKSELAQFRISKWGTVLTRLEHLPKSISTPPRNRRGLTASLWGLRNVSTSNSSPPIAQIRSGRTSHRQNSIKTYILLLTTWCYQRATNYITGYSRSHLRDWPINSQANIPICLRFAVYL